MVGIFIYFIHIIDVLIRSPMANAVRHIADYRLAVTVPAVSEKACKSTQMPSILPVSKSRELPAVIA